MGGRVGGQGFGGSKGNAGASPLSFVLFFFGLVFLMLVVYCNMCVCVYVCVCFPFDTAEVLSGHSSPGRIQRQRCQRRCFGIQE